MPSGSGRASASRTLAAWSRTVARRWRGAVCSTSSSARRMRRRIGDSAATSPDEHRVQSRVIHSFSSWCARSRSASSEWHAAPSRSSSARTIMSGASPGSARRSPSATEATRRPSSSSAIHPVVSAWTAASMTRWSMPSVGSSPEPAVDRHRASRRAISPRISAAESEAPVRSRAARSSDACADVRRGAPNAGSTSTLRPIVDSARASLARSRASARSSSDACAGGDRR